MKLIKVIRAKMITADIVKDLLKDEYIVKKSNGLVMYGYKSRQETNTETDILNNIICDENKNIVHYSGPYVNEKTITNDEASNISKILLFPEGTLMRIFYYNNKWNVATNRCLNASESYFTSSSSFLDIFNSMIDINSFYQNLDKSKCYCYILKHFDARVVLPVDKNEVIFFSETDLETLETIFNNDFLIDNLITDIEKFVEERYIVTVEYKSGERYKILSDEYLKIRDLKKINMNNPVLRVIDLLTKEDEQTISEYFKYFPEHLDTKVFVEKALTSFIKNVHRDYVNLKIYKQNLYFHKYYYNIIYRIHSVFINSDPRKSITPEDVKNVVYTTDSNTLRYCMFSIFKN